MSEYISIIKDGVTIKQFPRTQEVEAKAYAAQVQADMRYDQADLLDDSMHTQRVTQ